MEEENKQLLEEVHDGLLAESPLYLAFPDSKSTRIFTLCAGRRHHRICGHLSIANLDSGIQYEALSYEWGLNEHKPERRIQVNHQQFNVKHNLYRALKEIRHESRDRVLWIDALCIDQDNTQEKNHQVGLMRQIYSSAQTVLVWLGPSSRDSDIAMDLLSALQLGKSKINPSAVSEDGCCDAIFFLVQVLLGGMSKNSHSSELRSDLEIMYNQQRPNQRPKRQAFDIIANAIMNLLIWRTYWRRVWIIQEVMLARQIKIHCGAQAVSWDVLRYIDPISKLWDPVTASLASSTAYLLYQNNTLGSLAHQQKPFDVYHWLYMTTSSISTIPRDKIYGVLAISSNGDNVLVDYVKSDFDVCKELIKLYDGEDFLPEFWRSLRYWLHLEEKPGGPNLDSDHLVTHGWIAYEVRNVTSASISNVVTTSASSEQTYATDLLLLRSFVVLLEGRVSWLSSTQPDLLRPWDTQWGLCRQETRWLKDLQICGVTDSVEGLSKDISVEAGHLFETLRKTESGLFDFRRMTESFRAYFSTPYVLKSPGSGSKDPKYTGQQAFLSETMFPADTRIRISMGDSTTADATIIESQCDESVCQGVFFGQTYELYCKSRTMEPARPGDVVCLSPGLEYGLLLRHNQQTQTWELLGRVKLMKRVSAHCFDAKDIEDLKRYNEGWNMKISMSYSTLDYLTFP